MVGCCIFFKMTTYLNYDYVKTIIAGMLDHHRPVNTKVWSLQELCVAKIEQYSSIKTMIKFRAIPDAEYPSPAKYKLLRVNYMYHPTVDKILRQAQTLRKLNRNIISSIEVNPDTLFLTSPDRVVEFEFCELESNYYNFRCDYDTDEESASDSDE